MHLSAPLFRLKRDAKAMARERNLPLHQALDTIARSEGFRSWSHLSASLSKSRPAQRLAQALSPGDLMLIGARPGHGKTLLALDLLAEAVAKQHRGWIFSLEETAAAMEARLRDLGHAPEAMMGLTLDCSDAISASHIEAAMADAPRGSVAVIDYLQLLDQCRETPPLTDQVAALAAFAKARGATIIALSQIHRSFAGDGVPGVEHLRLPNPIDLRHVTKACFLHEGEIRLDAA